MKKLIAAAFLLVLFPDTGILSADELIITDDFSTMGVWRATSGSWEISVDGKLCQRDSGEIAAMITRPAAQNGFVTYEFELTILGGLGDGYGGFGIHIGITDPATGASWGNGRSYLLWITYDREPYGEESFYGQLYKSENFSTMKMLHEGKRYPVNLPGFEPGNPESVVGRTMQVSISLDFATGEGFFSDLSGNGRTFAFRLGAPVPPGTHLGFRTSSAQVAVDNLTVTVR